MYGPLKMYYRVCSVLFMWNKISQKNDYGHFAILYGFFAKAAGHSYPRNKLYCKRMKAAELTKRLTSTIPALQMKTKNFPGIFF